MAYLAQYLVTRSWYLSGIIARNLQTPTGDQINDGLQMLNDLLNWKQIEIDLIPYWTYGQFIAIPGQESYFLPNVVAIESLTFNIGTVRYPMDVTSRNTYFGTSRIDNISSLPFNWHFLRGLGGGTVYMYFLPDGLWPIKYMAKMSLTDVSLNTDMTTVYDTSYIEYLRYALAQYMCSEYGIRFNPESKEIMDGIVRQLSNVDPPDLRMSKISILTNYGGINFGDVNLGLGFRPS